MVEAKLKNTNKKLPLKNNFTMKSRNHPSTDTIEELNDDENRYLQETIEF